MSAPAAPYNESAIAAHVVLDSRFRENDEPGESAFAVMFNWIPVSPKSLSPLSRE